jgi:hypothetical protein
MGRGQRVLLVSTACLLVVAATGWLWWAQVRQNPNRIFWDMISNNLSTNGVTHISEQSGQGLEVSQYTQISFGQHPRVHALTVFKEGSSTLATEQISDAQHDFVRYQQIAIPSTSKRLETKQVLGKWAKLQTGQTVTGQLTGGLFNQSLLDVLPIGNLSSQQRTEILRAMHAQSLFRYDSEAVKKVKVRGREVYLYAVTIKPDAYTRIMQQFEALIGADTYAKIKPDDLAKAKPLSIVISIDVRSHNLSQIYDVSRERTERYEGFGLTDTTPLPRATITTVELTQRLARLLQK